MATLSKGITDLTNNVTEQHFFELLGNTHLENCLDYLDSMFNGFLYTGGFNDRYNGDAFYFYQHLRNALIVANQQHEMSLENEKKTTRRREQQAVPQGENDKTILSPQPNKEG